MKFGNFDTKFVDMMIGVILGLGFQWWPELSAPWQYIAFLFAYVDIIDYWIDYGPSLRKFPPRKELDILIDVAIMFCLFLYIYASQQTLLYFLCTFVLLRLVDYFWLLRARFEHPDHQEMHWAIAWAKFDLIEVAFGGVLIAVFFITQLPPIMLISLLVVGWIIIRAIARIKFRKVHFI